MESLIEDAVGGKTLPASMVPGIEFPMPDLPIPASQPAPPPEARPYVSPTQTVSEPLAGVPLGPAPNASPGQGTVLGSPGLDPFALPPGAGTPFPRGVQQEPSAGSSNLNWAWALMAVGFLCGCGFVAHIPALLLAYQAKKQGHPSANVAVIIGWVMLALSIGGLIVLVISMMA